MLHNLGQNNSLLTQFMAELRDINIQKDRLRFRRNIERIGEILAYEISQCMHFKSSTVISPMGKANCQVLSAQPVILTILRAGIPLQNGLLNFFDQADAAFTGAYRKHDKAGNFSIALDYMACPDLNGRCLIVCDPMLASGSSLALTIKEIKKTWAPSVIHVATVIACSIGVNKLLSEVGDVQIWTAALDDELDARSYIVPGLGDAGDLAFGQKLQG